MSLKSFIAFMLIPLTHGYIYHSNVCLHQPYCIQYNPHTKKDFKKITKEDAYSLSDHWSKELKCIQSTISRNSLQNIDMLYAGKNDQYLNMNELTNFHYNIINDNGEKEYIVWKPKIKPKFILENPQSNSMSYPCFRQTMCVSSFSRCNNDVYIHDVLYTPLWKGDNREIRRNVKKNMIQYFLVYLKHKQIHFQRN